MLIEIIPLSEQVTQYYEWCNVNQLGIELSKKKKKKACNDNSDNLNLGGGVQEFREEVPTKCPI